MREIKFRGKTSTLPANKAHDQINGRWFYGYLIGDKKRNYYIKESSKSEGFWVEPETIGQFTGLLDKNGKEIYEGDVIQNKGVQIKVEWDNYQCGFNIKEYGIHLFETIGNIHDQSI